MPQTLVPLTERDLLAELRRQAWSTKPTSEGWIATKDGKTFSWHHSVFDRKANDGRAWQNFRAQMKRVGFQADASRRTIPCLWASATPPCTRMFSSKTHVMRHAQGSHGGKLPDGTVVTQMERPGGRPKKTTPVPVQPVAAPLPPVIKLPDRRVDIKLPAKHPAAVVTPLEPKKVIDPLLAIERVAVWLEQAPLHARVLRDAIEELKPQHDTAETVEKKMQEVQALVEKLVDLV